MYNILIDIGGTNFRISDSQDSKMTIIEHNITTSEDMFLLIEKQIKLFMNKNIYDKMLNKIIIAFPGIVYKNKLYECNNLTCMNNNILPDKIIDIKCQYMNDGDLALLGEIEYNKVDKNKNILNLIFGTGVGSGIWCDKLITNSEVVKIFEGYLGGKKFKKDNIQEIRDKFVFDLGIVIEMINLDVIIINGFIKNYKELIISKDDLEIRDFYKKKLQIIYSDCKEPVILGGKILK